MYAKCMYIEHTENDDVINVFGGGGQQRLFEIETAISEQLFENGLFETSEWMWNHNNMTVVKAIIRDTVRVYLEQPLICILIFKKRQMTGIKFFDLFMNLIKNVILWNILSVPFIVPSSPVYLWVYFRERTVLVVSHIYWISYLNLPR